MIQKDPGVALRSSKFPGGTLIWISQEVFFHKQYVGKSCSTLTTIQVYSGHLQPWSFLIVQQYNHPEVDRISTMFNM